jgi:methionine aminopeptidase
MGVVRTYCGHGIGEFFHCAPNVPHYAKNKAKGVMRVGEVFTIGACPGPCSGVRYVWCETHA